MTKPKGSIQKWAEKIDWDRRVQAVCKPCWELKYCPYGPLIEEFQIPEGETHRYCRVFGHICPVFEVAEPFTETKELRNISRRIPRPVQFRVMKRENQVCRSCGMPVADGDVHFDHIIPWSKGGPTEESNIQLLCGSCNRKKSDKYEREFLVSSARGHLSEPVGSSILEFLLLCAKFRHDFLKNEKRLPDAADFAKELNKGRKTEREEHGAQIVLDLEAVLANGKPSRSTRSIHEALQLRWGYKDFAVRKLKVVARECDLPLEQLLEYEIELVETLGWVVKDTVAERRKWIAT